MSGVKKCARCEQNHVSSAGSEIEMRARVCVCVCVCVAYKYGVFVSRRPTRCPVPCLVVMIAESISDTAAC